MKRTGIVIPAGGSGTRMGSGEGLNACSGADSDATERAEHKKKVALPKQFMPLGEGLNRKPVLAHTIEALAKAVPDADIVVALPRAHVETWEGLCREYNVPTHKVCTGGDGRFDSVRRALGELDPDCEYIAVHDAVRPLVSAQLVKRALETAAEHGSAVPVVPLTDSVRRLGEQGASHPEERDRLVAVQTPQIFRADILRAAYEQAGEMQTGRGAENETRAGGVNFTDDAGVVEAAGYNVVLCAGEKRNLKITEPIDIVIAEAILKAETKEAV